MCVKCNTKNEKIFMKYFCDRLKSLRGEKSQAEIARLLGVKQQNWARWENGVVFPGAETLHHICATFHVSADWLLGLSVSPPDRTRDKVADLKKAIITLLKEY